MSLVQPQPTHCYAEICLMVGCYGLRGLPLSRSAPRGGWGSTCLEIIPNKYQFFCCIPILEHICTFGSYVSQIRQVANQRWPSHTNSEVALLRLLLEKTMKNQGVSASSPLSEVKALREGADKTSSFSF